jgi:hypothetical protein
MRYIGFSTGALACGDVDRALQMLLGKRISAIEVSALRQHELEPLVERLDQLNIPPVEYIAFHAPSAIDPAFETRMIDLLLRVRERGWPIIVHPNVIYRPELWHVLGQQLCIENMDKRKPIGRTAADLGSIFATFENACLCFDLGHVRQVDPTMSEAADILRWFSDRLRQLHVSEVNAQSRHDPLTLEAVMAYKRIARLLPGDIPVIIESRVPEEGIQLEIDAVLEALTPDELGISGLSRVSALV